MNLSGYTIRQVLRATVGGSQLQLRLSNEHTARTTTIGAVYIAISMANGEASGGIVSDTDRVVTFGGSPSVVLAPGAPALSDPINLPIDPLTSLAVSIYVASGATPQTYHATGVQTAYIVSGNHVADPDLSIGSTLTTARYLLSGLDAFQTASSVTIDAFGDSITDGFRSTPDANRRWPDVLAQRLQDVGRRTVAVLNAGLSGNRLLLDGTGLSAQGRFERDVLSRPGVRYVIVMVGINDIRHATDPGATPVAVQDLTNAYQQLVVRAHELGLWIFGGTLTPFQGSSSAAKAGEPIRQGVNDYIRNHSTFDGVIDFDAVVRDPSNPARLLPAYDSGDHLHPNDAGYAAMGNAIDLSLFQ